MLRTVLGGDFGLARLPNVGNGKGETGGCSFSITSIGSHQELFSQVSQPSLLVDWFKDSQNRLLQFLNHIPTFTLDFFKT